MSALPLTSIIIPVHNCRALTEACLHSLFEHTDAPYELILIDDAGDSETAEYLRGPFPCTARLLRNETRQCYAVNNNAGERVAAGKYLCLLNNDTLLTAGWLSPLVRLLEADASVGVLGNKHLFPDSGRLHHAGMAFDDEDYPWHIHPNTDPSLPAVNKVREFQCVTFACVLIPRSVYRELNGLDESYRNGFEDCDFCLRARQRGWRVLYTPESVIYHYGQSTPGRKTNDDANRRLFATSWSGRVTRDLLSLQNQDARINGLKGCRTVGAIIRDWLSRGGLRPGQ